MLPTSRSTAARQRAACDRRDLPALRNRREIAAVSRGTAIPGKKRRENMAVKIDALRSATDRRIGPTGMVMTAQDSFREFTKAALAPMFRELGFKGSGQKFSFPASDHFIQIGVQKSSYSDKDEIRFTLNVQIVPIGEWAEAAKLRAHFPKVPSPNTYYGVGFQERVGLMRPEKLDLWWRFSTNTDKLALLEEIRGLLVEHVIPVIRKTMKQEAQQGAGADATRPHGSA